MHSQFIARNSDADCRSETRGVLVSIGELKLCTARGYTKRPDETKWSETWDETPRPFGPRPRRDAQFWTSETQTRPRR